MRVAISVLRRAQEEIRDLGVPIFDSYVASKVITAGLRHSIILQGPESTQQLLGVEADMDIYLKETSLRLRSKGLGE